MNKLFSEKKWKAWNPENKQFLDEKNIINVEKSINDLNNNKLLKSNNLSIIEKKRFKVLKTNKKIEYSKIYLRNKKNEYFEGFCKGEEKGYSEGFYKGEKNGYSEGFYKGEKNGYSEGFRKGSIKFEKYCYNVQAKLESFILDFESSLNTIDSIISDRLFEIVIKMSKKFFDNINIERENNVLLKNIKKVLSKDLMFVKKLQVHVNPKDKQIVKKYFGRILKLHQWDLHYNIKVSKGGFKIISEQSNFDVTLPTYWKELCKTM